MRRNAITILGLSIIHLIASLLAFMWSFGVTSDRFDGRKVSWLSAHFADAASSLLNWPLHTLLDFGWLQGLHSNALYWLLSIMQSLLWGAIALLLFRWLRKRLRAIRVQD
ncbi:hypothetical protein [Chitinimonas sp.]|uniref:hypothetical protein n=1 Tax=Chitinimonas sp. TaxID=1934313 RepID=UPI0035AFA446